MYYIVALGNPGPSYVGTRHNLGYAVADALVTRHGLPEPRESARYHGRLTEGVIAGETVTLLWPLTYMNHSGVAVRTLLPQDRLSSLVVIHDEVALPLGKVRISQGSGAAGHNGVASIIDTLGTSDFIRVRLGIGAPPPPLPLDRFVLSRFLPEERDTVAALTERGCTALEYLIARGVPFAMQEINQ